VLAGRNPWRCYVSTATSIEWTDRTWNPVRGCSRISEGCRNCYAEGVARRFSGPGLAYEGLADAGGWTRKVRLVPEALEEPLRWRKPQRIFVSSMSDLFHEDVPHTFIVEVFAIMALARWHVFQVLTKRAEGMRDTVASAPFQREVIESAYALAADWNGRRLRRRDEVGFHGIGWPLPNVHLGVSVEDQGTADERIPLLLQTPAAVQFVSVEPLLGEVILREAWLHGAWIECPLEGRRELGLATDAENPCAGCPGWGIECGAERGPAVDWVIVGGESGPRARPCDVAWIRSIVEQCRAAGVPCFTKQLGARPYEMIAAGNHGGDYFHEPRELRLRDRKGGDPAEWPTDLRVREFPRC
jgi:protein gp37